MLPGTTAPTPLKTETVDRLRVHVYADRQGMGRAAGKDIAARIMALHERQEIIRIVFAAAPSQHEVLDALVAARQIDWARIDVFHMDEYVGLPAGAPPRFSHFLNQRLFHKVMPRTVHLIDGGAPDTDAACRQYAALLTQDPIDIVCLGIGENGHIAFNDPPVADFADAALVKRVRLDAACRQQQVNDGCFPALDAVPTEALTLTIPALLAGRHLFCVVPGKTKTAAVRSVLRGPVATACPASVLRTHPDCTLYVDPDAYGEPLP